MNYNTKIMERLSFYVNKKIIYVTISRTDNKNMYLKIDETKGIYVLAPKKLKISIIENFVQENIEKFVNYQNQIQKNVLFSLKEEFLFLFGKKHSFKVLTGFKKLNYKINNNVFYFNTKTGQNNEVIQIIKMILKKELEKFVNPKQKEWEIKLNIPKHTIGYTYKNSNWGSNNLNKQRIIYSTKLAHYQFEVINYVIIHELAHYFQPNHSKDFWQIVKSNLPHYQKLQNVLKNKDL